MKRLHVYISVPSIDKAVSFHSTLFAAKPPLVKEDYAKWMLEDPRVNFAISSCGQEDGLSNLGIEVDSGSELGDVYDRLEDAGEPMLKERTTKCCYHQPEKLRINNPANIA